MTRMTRGLCLEVLSNREIPFCIDRDKSSEGSYQVLVQSLMATIKKFREAGFERVLIMKPWPEFKYFTSECLASDFNACSISKKDFNQYAGLVDKAIEHVEKSFDNVKSFDPKDYLCQGDECKQIISTNFSNTGYMPVVHDDDHGTSIAAKYVGRKIHNLLHWLTRTEQEELQSNT